MSDEQKEETFIEKFPKWTLTIAFTIGMFTGNSDRIIDYVMPSLEERFVTRSEFEDLVEKLNITPIEVDVEPTITFKNKGTL